MIIIYASLAFLYIAVIAAIFGFTGIYQAATGTAYTMFFMFFVIFTSGLMINLTRHKEY